MSKSHLTVMVPWRAPPPLLEGPYTISSRRHRPFKFTMTNTLLDPLEQELLANDALESN
ncbi:MAG: hypothetical protein AAF525_20225 [Pseudomonadota bacterium]